MVWVIISELEDMTLQEMFLSSLYSWTLSFRTQFGLIICIIVLREFFVEFNKET